MKSEISVIQRDWLFPRSSSEAWLAEMRISGASFARRNQRIVEMRRAGLSFAEIGRQVGLTRSYVSTIVARYEREIAAALNHFDFAKPNARKAAYGVWHVFDAQRDREAAGNAK